MNPPIENEFIDYSDEPGWLMTYADLMTLLMVFFVLLYSLASFETQQYKTTIASVRTQVKQHPEMNGIMPLLGSPDGFEKKIRIEEITGLRSRETALYQSMENLVKNSAVKDRLGIKASDGKIIVTISGEALFNSGSATLNPTALPEIDDMIDLFEQYTEYNINIKGHTDNVPIATQMFPSNWELSAIRATTVLKYLISKGIDPRRLTATGYGDLIPLAGNDTEADRAKNRRVEFVLEKKESN